MTINDSEDEEHIDEGPMSEDATNEVEINEQTSLLRPYNNDGHLNNIDSVDSSVRVIQNTNLGISWYFAVFLIVNAALGAGLLNFAKAFDNAGGILVSSIIHLVYYFLKYY